MRMLMVGTALMMMTSAAMTFGAMTSSAMADDDDDRNAQKLAMQGRDDYWHCLAREYSRESNQGLSEQDFGRSVAGACPSERQYYRVALLDYLAAQYPNIDAGAHLATANRAVESAQKDIVTAFVKHRPPQK
ncbi:hypothetical protein A5906_16390 [Bradyrhizobium sacchari]|uniref:Uncharacterized protein n=1 Tax=Bradyrhizobium sacchari TaxID=1399419 RepID=A0A560K4V4_9BRAD|nr:hypothetical protein [Bradyrhizobium sacchari]OPY93895.1 hypothetical protein A5906_16390 [Bradyrhizobium sacchari]TWB53920.1 hypothetical protein FBZ94_108202 [Bradyrhizobium sacchari]TWB78368.1 hypothetical protein FBZ95_103202 [Bradyrhizobium sacchari]